MVSLEYQPETIRSETNATCTFFWIRKSPYPEEWCVYVLIAWPDGEGRWQRVATFDNKKDAKKYTRVKNQIESHKGSSQVFEQWPHD